MWCCGGVIGNVAGSVKCGVVVFDVSYDVGGVWCYMC